MAYFNELPFIEYPLRFENQSSNEDYTLVKNIFRRARIREDIADAATAFNYYQIRDDERPDQIAERFYGDPELDWVVLITNNITNYPSQWTISNESLYDYMMDKYGSEEELTKIKYIETNEVRDEYERLVMPAKLQIDKDSYQEFTTFNKEKEPLFYDLKSYPIPSKYKPLTVTTNLGQYLEVWERDNLGEGEEYTGEEYNLEKIYLQDVANVTNYDTNGVKYPAYSRLDYSYLEIYDRDNKPNDIFSPVTLNGWPYKWGGELYIYYRGNKKDKVNLFPNIYKPTEITDDFRLYTISSLSSIDTFTYTEGTTIRSKANQTYNITTPKSDKNGIQAKFEIKRNSLGEIILVNLLNEGIRYDYEETLTIKGSKIGGIDGKDDIQININKVTSRPQFRFLSIGDADNDPLTVNEPFNNTKITIFNEAGYSYLDTTFEKVDIFNNQNEVSYYEYETNLNETYRNILILKPQYLGVLIDNFKNIMNYDKSSETINNKLKRVSNPKVIG